MCAARNPSAKLYLASTSPRRRDLLQSAGIDFELHEPGPEPAGSGTPPQLAIERARAKAVGAARPPEGGAVLGVDTVVDLEGEEFCKPADRAAAAEMLVALRGREHLVHTGHCLVPASGGRVVERRTEARVRCLEFSTSELEAYLDTGDWRGKAGGYGIQDAGAGFMRLVEGEIDTVVGLNVVAVRELLGESEVER